MAPIMRTDFPVMVDDMVNHTSAWTLDTSLVNSFGFWACGERPFSFFAVIWCFRKCCEPASLPSDITHHFRQKIQGCIALLASTIPYFVSIVTHDQLEHKFCNMFTPSQRCFCPRSFMVCAHAEQWLTRKAWQRQL